MRDGWRKLTWSGVALGVALASVERYRQRRRLEQRSLFRGKLAIVTGGSRGLGFLLARELAREGCRVVICARDKDELERARRALADEGADVTAKVCDVANREQVEAFVNETEESLGPVDVLVNNAGIITAGPIETMTVEDYKASLDVMFWGTVHTTLAVLPHMLERRRGRIVNITSIGGKVSVPHLSTYASAKFAALGFSEGLRAELAQDGIKVTSVVPGLMRTGSHVNALFKGSQEAEYRWFALSASLPFISMDAERAAREILRAVKRGDAEYIVGMPARMAAWAHGLCPGWTADLAGVVNRFLPRSRRADLRLPGRELERRQRSSIWKLLIGLGRESVSRFQDHREARVVHPIHEASRQRG